MNPPMDPSMDLVPEDEAPPLTAGLYLVATPIGNLEDITLRALRVLRDADCIACEDTRQTRKLMNRFGIRTPLVSCHEHNERERAESLMASIRAGQRIAVVSDAGMPSISDPGAALVAEAIRVGLPVIPIPGANAALTGLIASGLKTESFRFLGFLPEKAGARRNRLEQLAASAGDAEETLIFYEAPHRILETLADLEAVWGARLRVVVARELTKLHEELLRGEVGEVKANLAARERVRGEMVLLVEVRPLEKAAPDAATGVQARVERMQREAEIDEKEALKRLARELGQSKSELYRELQRERARR